MKLRFISAGAACLLLAPAAPAETPTPRPVHFATCTAAGVESGCVVARGDDGALYNVTGALPGLKPGHWLQGTAKVTNRITTCMQGKTIGDFSPDVPQKPGACRRGP